MHRGRVARGHTIFSLRRRNLNPHLFAQTQLLRLKFRQRFFQLVRQCWPRPRRRPWDVRVAGPAPSSVSRPRNPPSPTSLSVLSIPIFCDFVKALHKILVAALRILHRILQSRDVAGKTQLGSSGLRRQPQQFLRLLPRSLCALRQRLELGHLVGRGLNRQCVIEILQTRVARASGPASARRAAAPPPPCPPCWASSARRTKQQNNSQGQLRRHSVHVLLSLSATRV